jgi:hypothetical protein
VPLVFDAGGPVEIVRNAGIGATFKSIEHAARTIAQWSDANLRREIAQDLDVRWVESTLETAFALRLQSVLAGLQAGTEKRRRQ